MSSRLITHWTDYASALREILPSLSRNLRIFDEDLSHTDLESPAHSETLRRFLGANRNNVCEIILRNPSPFRNDSPRLMAILGLYSERLRVFECPAQILTLHDNILLVDEKCALIRIHKDHARSKVILDDAEECRPYAERFNEILAECSTRIYPTTLGL
ncbi:MAG: hypothetical protein LBL72_01695 [Candidatus Accumulibacter sp.]|jgi:hypothetical protein|nr:hypothetical protein [Accumulibacter sp.]